MMRYLMLPVLLLVASHVAAKPPRVGDMAPPFEIKMDDGSKVTLEQLRGNVVVLNFWATWCVPCLAELPLLDAMYAKNGHHGLNVFAISSADSAPVARQKKVFDALRLPWVRSIRGPYVVLKGVPTNYIIDRSGHIRLAKAGSLSLAEINNLLIPMLNEPRPPVTDISAATG